MQVLLGPFVDVEQPLIAGGMIDVTFQQLFQTQVGSTLQRRCVAHMHLGCLDLVGVLSTGVG